MPKNFNPLSRPQAIELELELRLEPTGLVITLSAGHKFDATTCNHVKDSIKTLSELRVSSEETRFLTAPYEQSKWSPTLTKTCLLTK